ncbi:hypothetical protein PoB_000119500 [Plakobranchus ocellatus]|uniref:Uncharacterized protein n=1 Tax=Plakobranchus ocellatus TaxID=259542 RepID=A0AAV3XV54_9GAST|nr:hypothetical protein PoB_000119500 [Plakobranchus ocellatus]
MFVATNVVVTSAGVTGDIRDTVTVAVYCFILLYSNKDARPLSKVSVKDAHLRNTLAFTLWVFSKLAERHFLSSWSQISKGHLTELCEKHDHTGYIALTTLNFMVHLPCGTVSVHGLRCVVRKKISMAVGRGIHSFS